LAVNDESAHELEEYKMREELGPAKTHSYSAWQKVHWRPSPVQVEWRVQPDPLRDLDLDPVLGFHPAVLLLLTLPKSSNE